MGVLPPFGPEPVVYSKASSVEDLFKLRTAAK
jgi:hypothetical protein